MKKISNIEELLKKFCETMEEIPPQDMWDRIEATLDKKHNQNRIIWMKRIAVAASLAIFVSLSTLLWVSIISTEENTILSETEIINENNIEDDDNQVNKHSEKNIYVKQNYPTAKNKHITHLAEKNEEKGASASENFTKSTPAETISNKGVKTSNDNFVSNEKFEIKKSKEEKPDLKVQDNYNVDLFFINYFPEPANKKQAAKIELGGAFSPVYSYRQSSVENNPYFPNTNKEVPDEEGIIYGGGGLNLNVKFNKKWSVESGVKYAKLGHKIKNPDAISSIFVSKGSEFVIHQVFLGNTLGSAIIDESYLSKNNDYDNIPPSPPYSVNVVDDKRLNNSIEQNLDYLEVPFTLRYYLLDDKFSVSMSAGLSANFLINNSFYIKSNNYKEKIGETSGISNISMSSHAGLSINVPVFKHLSLQVEPRINYFLQEINKDYTFKYRPYSFGIYSGIKYKFGK